MSEPRVHRDRRGWAVTKRARFVAKRRRNGLDRPAPTPVLVVNFASISFKAERVTGIVKRVSEVVAEHDVKLVIGVEASLVDNADFDPKVFDLFHRQWPVDQAGSVLAAVRPDASLHDRGLVLGGRAGLGIRKRWVAHARSAFHTRSPGQWSATAGAAHPQPKRAWALWPGFMRRVRDMRLDIVGGDFNKLQRAVQPALGRRVRSVHIIGLAHRWWIPSSRAVPIDVGSDHPAVLVTLWPEKADRKGRTRGQRSVTTNPFHIPNKETR